MIFNFQADSLTAVLIYWGVVVSTIVFSFLDTIIGERKDRKKEAERQNPGKG